ncbi:hypothetical protein WR25_21420 [Diploscapter pachys]|uniref:Uncharacterized protein n=1 Tax=Diploscapter pachys TaxID=2018661 RepID=A0A2A2K8A9_9BILA|nr:hypothetical protein WR25_21420 [Diploscapter pachys]
MRVSAHDDQIGRQGLGLHQQLLADRHLRLIDVRLGLDAMTRQVGNQVVGSRRVGARGREGQDVHRLGARDERQRGGDRVCRLDAAVPGDRDRPGEVGCEVAGHDQHGAAGRLQRRFQERGGRKIFVLARRASEDHEIMGQRRSADDRVVISILHTQRDRRVGIAGWPHFPQKLTDLGFAALGSSVQMLDQLIPAGRQRIVTVDG